MEVNKYIRLKNQWNGKVQTRAKQIQKETGKALYKCITWAAVQLRNEGHVEPVLK